MNKKSEIARITVITLTLIIISSIFLASAFAQAQESNQITVNRNIYVYQGFLIVNDKINLPNNITTLYYYYTPQEYDSIYSLKVSQGISIISGQYYNGLQGYKLILNGQTSINIITVYNYTIFIQQSIGYAVNITAYPLINYHINSGNATVTFKFSVSTFFASSPKDAKEKVAPNGEQTILYGIANITPFNKTPLYFNFTPSSPLQFPKITDFTREIQIINQNEAQIIDTVTIEYTGFGQSINQWKPPLLPGSHVVEVFDSIGNLTYQNGIVNLRYPLESSVLGGTSVSITVVSKINLSELSNGTNNLIYYNFLANNTYLIDNFKLVIDSKYISNINLQPLPDILKSASGYNQYIYVLKKVFPQETFMITVNGQVQAYIATLNTFNQILFILTIISLISFAYIRFYYKAPKVEAKLKVPLLKKYIELVESLIINNEETMKLDDQLRRGVIKKKDYSIRLENLTNERVSNERDMKKLSSQIIKENPDLNKLIVDLENSYQRLIKGSNALKNLFYSYDQKKIKIDQYRRMYKQYMDEIQKAKAKIDSLLSDLRNKIE